MARASSDEVQIFDNRNNLIQTCDFWTAFPGSTPEERSAHATGIQAVRLRSATSTNFGSGGSNAADRNVFLLATLGPRLVVWTASAVSTSSKKWRIHSTLHLSSDIHSVDLHNRHLLLGCGQAVQLWTLGEGDHFWRRMWSRRGPSRIRHVEFDPEGLALAASAAGDRRILVWRIQKRRANASEDIPPIKSDVLVHPYEVVAFQWRGSPEANNSSEALISRTSDGTARVWAPVIDQPTKLRLSASVDRHSFGKVQENSRLEFRQGPSPVFYLDAATMSAVINSNISLLERDLQLVDVDLNIGDVAHQTIPSEKANEQKRTRIKRLQHLLTDSPDTFVCIQADGSLVMRALAHLDRRPPTLLQAFTVLKLPQSLPVEPTQLAALYLLPLGFESGQSSEAPLAFLCFQNDTGSSLNVEFNPALVFDGQGEGLSCQDSRLASTAALGDITTLMRCSSSSTIVAVGTSQTAICCRSIRQRGQSHKWHLQCVESLLLEGKVLLSYNGDAILCWQNQKQQLIYETLGSESASILLDGIASRDSIAAVILSTDAVSVMSKTGQITDWTISPGEDRVSGSHQDSTQTGLQLALAVRSRSPRKPGDQSYITIDTEGTISWWRRRTFRPDRANWFLAASIPTHQTRVTLAAASAGGLVALVSEGKGARQLEVWDVAASEFASPLQFSQTIANKQVVAMDWLEDEQSEGLLVIASLHRITVLSRKRPSLFEGSVETTQSWRVLACLTLDSITTRPLTAVNWTPEAAIVAATGATLHLVGPLITDGQGVKAERQYLLRIAAATLGPLPSYHPSMLLQCMLWVKLDVAKRLASELLNAVEHVPAGETAVVDEFTDLQIEEILHDVRSQESIYLGNGAPNTSHAALFDNSDNDGRDDLKHADIDRLDRLRRKLNEGVIIPDLTKEDIQNLRIVLHTLSQVIESRRSLDEDGLRYLIALRAFESKEKTRKINIMSTNAPIASAFEQPRLRHREFVWALHSTSQETLMTAVQEAFDGKLPWAKVRSTGAFLWLQSPTAIAALAEQVARDQFMSSQDRDPVSCSLFYYALGRHKLVLNLWRQAAWHPEQRKMLTFLANDFESERWRSAALKNAFALLSQRRFEFAACFFLLGESLQDAVNVCVRNLQDLHLALALARIKEGRDDGPVFTSLLKTKVLPLVFENGYRWLGHWCFWMLKMRDFATSILVSPLSELREDPRIIALLPKSDVALSTAQLRYDDVALAIFFAELKRTTLLTMKGSREISPRKEWGFVLHMNRTLRRMGCHVIGLALLAGWEFDPPTVPSRTAVEIQTKDAKAQEQAHEPSGPKSHPHPINDLFAALNERPASPPLSPPRRQASSLGEEQSLEPLPESNTFSQPNGAFAPMSPPRTLRKASQRRRSSLLRRRSSVINDLDIRQPDVDREQETIGQQQTKSPSSADPVAPDRSGSAVSMLHKTEEISVNETAEQEITEERGTTTETKEPEKPKGTLFAASSTSAQQGAQEFDFNSFF